MRTHVARLPPSRFHLRAPRFDGRVALRCRGKGSRSLIIAFVLVAVRSAAAQPPLPPILQEPQTLLLWPGGAPGALGQEDRDKPAITIYMPPNTTGPMTAVIIAPGGSYARLSMNNEGRAPANYLNTLGVAAFVLRYRLGPRSHQPVEVGDAQCALRCVRSCAA